MVGIYLAADTSPPPHRACPGAEQPSNGHTKMKTNGQPKCKISRKNKPPCGPRETLPSVPSSQRTGAACGTTYPPLSVVHTEDPCRCVTSEPYGRCHTLDRGLYVEVRLCSTAIYAGTTSVRGLAHRITIACVISNHPWWRGACMRLYTHSVHTYAHRKLPKGHPLCSIHPPEISGVALDRGCTSKGPLRDPAAC